jgi:hypothetical protein
MLVVAIAAAICAPDAASNLDIVPLWMFGSGNDDPCARRGANGAPLWRDRGLSCRSALGKSEPRNSGLGPRAMISLLRGHLQIPRLNCPVKKCGTKL